MKLSEQYKRKLNELTPYETTSLSNTPDTSILPTGDLSDPFTYAHYAMIGVAAATLIFGPSLFKKLFSKSSINKNGITRYNIFQKLKDKKALRSLGVTDEEMRDIWVKMKKAITTADTALISSTIEKVKTGEVTSKEAMRILKKLIPKGSKAEELETLQSLELLAKTSKLKTTNKPYSYTTTTKPTTKSINKITSDQLNRLTVNQKVAYSKNPNLTYSQLLKY